MSEQDISMRPSCWILWGFKDYQTLGNFSGGPVVKTLYFQSRGHMYVQSRGHTGLIAGWEMKFPYAVEYLNKY